MVLIYFTKGCFNLDEAGGVQVLKDHHTIFRLLNISPLPVQLQEFEWLEYYAGKAACTASMRRAGYTSARFDFLYFDPLTPKRSTRNYYDILTPAGFAFLR